MATVKTKVIVTDLQDYDRDDVRYAVRAALDFYPNDLSDRTGGEIIRNAFYRIRQRVVVDGFHEACRDRRHDAERYADM
jgi:hypothetical protein